MHPSPVAWEAVEGGSWAPSPYFAGESPPPHGPCTPHAMNNWEGVTAGSWAISPYHTGTPDWYRSGARAAPQQPTWLSSGGGGGGGGGRRVGPEPNPKHMFGTLGGPPPPMPTDLSQPHFLGQLRALKMERDILERQLEEARIARVEGHMWNAPQQWPGHSPGGAASRGWHAEVPRYPTGAAAAYPQAAGGMRPGGMGGEAQQLAQALSQQQHEIESLQMELGSLRQTMAQKRTAEGQGKAERHKDTRQVIANIYKRCNPAKIPNVEKLAQECRGKEDLLVRLLQHGGA